MPCIIILEGKGRDEHYLLRVNPFVLLSSLNESTILVGCLPIYLPKATQSISKHIIEVSFHISILD